jgi:hypothetical protein
MHKTVIWNTGPAAMRARHNLKLNKNKKIKRTPGPKLQAASAIKRTTLDGTEIILKE